MVREFHRDLSVLGFSHSTEQSSHLANEGEDGETDNAKGKTHVDKCDHDDIHPVVNAHDFTRQGVNEGQTDV